MTKGWDNCIFSKIDNLLAWFERLGTSLIVGYFGDAGKRIAEKTSKFGLSIATADYDPVYYATRPQR